MNAGTITGRPAAAVGDGGGRRRRASPETRAEDGSPAMSFPAGPHTADAVVRRRRPIRRGPWRWAWRLISPEWHQELLALALIIMTVAVGWLLARY